MKATRINLCSCVRNSLWMDGYSTVAIVNAVCAELGKLKLVKEESKTGNGNIKKEGFSVSVTGTFKYESKERTMPLVFDAWHSAISKAEKIAKMETVDIPAVFKDWLEFAKHKTKEDCEKEKASAQLA